MPILLHIIISPFAAFFMALLWAASLGDTFFYLIPKNNMIEEWITCILIYFAVVIFSKLKKVTKK